MKPSYIITIIVSLFLLSSCDEGCEQLGDGYVYFDEQKFIAGMIDIPPTVISYSYDEDYIIATQELTHNEPACLLPSFSDSVYPKNKSGQFYWVIIKKEQDVFGPLDEEGYRIIKERYHIPERLKNRIRVLSKNEEIISDYAMSSTMAAIDSTFCLDLAFYKGWNAQKRHPNLYWITIVDTKSSKKSFWVLRRKDICVRMNLPENVLYGWIPLDELSNNELWNHYYKGTVSEDKISSFINILDKYGIEEITVNQHDFRIIAKQTILRLPFYPFQDDHD